MADSTLKDFVREALARGESRAAIAAALKSAGWPDDQAKDALAAFADVDFPVPVPRPRRFGGAREAFLYIVFFSLLGVVATQIGRLSFSLINDIFADPLHADWRDWRASGLRWSIASLIVGYPIFLYLGWRLGAARRTDPERRVSRVRAWLTYVTLIFAALTLIGDLVVVVYNFLGGELGNRFLAKAGVVAVISGAILFNYTRDAERVSAGVDWPGRALAMATTLVAAALVAWAFLHVDSPAAARARAFDEQRITHLYAIGRRVDCYRSYFGQTPETLDALDKALTERAARQPAASGCTGDVPDDPETGAPYGYEKLDGDAFRLCAVFARGWPEGEDDAAPYGYSYGALADGGRRTLAKPETPGETCFDLEAVDFLDDEEKTENSAEPPSEAAPNEVTEPE